MLHRGRRPFTDEERAASFWRRVRKDGPMHAALPDPCWIWTAGTSGIGAAGRQYGKATWGTKSWQAHRLSWTLTNGTIPHGLLVLHKCDNPPCVNPAHLFLGDYLANEADKSAKNRGPVGDRNWTRQHPELLRRGEDHHARRRPECMARGERHGCAKLTEADVGSIRAALASGGSTRALADKYRVSTSTILLIGARRTWRHVS